MLKQLSFVALASLGVGLVGCASDEGAKRSSSSQSGHGVWSASEGSRGGVRASADPSPGMSVDNQMGVLETADVEDTLQARLDDVRACYERAGKAQEYAGGRVLLRFMVAGDGRVDDVLVTESTLGNYAVERCVVDIGRHVVFDAPSGHRSTTFDYPIEFRSTNAMPVLDIDGLKIDRDVAAFLPQLASCGPLAKDDVAAIMYIEPNGFPGSVGLAAPAALDEGAATCAVQAIRGWKMSAALPGRVLRATFHIPRVIAQADSSPTRHAVSSASARRRRR